MTAAEEPRHAAAVLTLIVHVELRDGDPQELRWIAQAALEQLDGNTIEAGPQDNAKDYGRYVITVHRSDPAAPAVSREILAERDTWSRA